MIFSSYHRQLISAHRQYMFMFFSILAFFTVRPSLGSSQFSPPELDFGSALFSILFYGQVEINRGPLMSGSLNLSLIFPCGYCEDPVTWEQRGIRCDGCDMWFHKKLRRCGIFHLPGIFHN